ncbi:MAG: hypothetical protein FJ295_17345 [Planctomycetes bacterium]|nr:hypothetical protein [Planctomycetota bacterium]
MICSRFFSTHVRKYACLTALIFSLLNLSRTLAGDEPIRIKSEKQLLADDFLVLSRPGLQRAFHPPVKANDGQPVLLFDQPWEEPGTSILGTVVRHEDRFRLWYRGSGSGPTGGIWCYAESEDGLHWTKPKLNLVMHQERRDHNIYVIGQPQAFTPFLDPNEKDPAKRYKSAVNTPRIDTALAYASDGLTWTPYRYGAAVTGRASDTISQVLWDPFANVYRLYTRTDYGTADSGEVRGTRDMIAARHADLSDPGSWRTVREWCLGWERGDRDYHRHRQIYSLNGWIHEGIQFGLIWTLETGNHERMNAYIATTRGEQPWNLSEVYADRELIPHGGPERFDCRWIQPAANIVTWNDRHWIYYAGSAMSHDGRWSPAIAGPKAGIGLATIRRDGFYSLQAGAAQGALTTKTFLFQGQRLELNYAAAVSGSVRVELQDADGKPIPGFRLSECSRLVGDELAQVVHWSHGSDLSSLADHPVRLHIHVQDADLFAFQFLQNP